MSLYDPLLEIEKSLETNENIQTNINTEKPKQITISKPQILCSTCTPTIWQNIWGKIKFLISYFSLSAAIFAIMMGVMNFHAYSARVMYWINPETYAQNSEDINALISQSQEQISQSGSETITENRDLIEEKIAKINPEIVYSRKYNEEGLLSNIPLSSTENATFQVAPIENRIVIPRMGKNIPLIDVYHDEGTSFTEMHDIFMEELKKGVVRYPGTALPGEKGNAFIFGHSSNFPWIQSDYNDVFALLDTLEMGDEIIVYYNQKKFVYKVTDTSIVKPGDTHVLGARDPNKKEISLMTCWPVGTTNERLIVFGELVESN